MMRKNTNSSWQQAFTKRLTHPRFVGTGWEKLYATLVRASAKTVRGTEPFWVGVELTYPLCSLGYTGVLCADNTGDILCTSALQWQTRALEAMRNQWPSDHQLRFLTDENDLRRAARRSCVFGAVVDAASPAALSLAKSLAKTIAIGNMHTALRALIAIAPPSSRRGGNPAGAFSSTPAPFDVLLRSRTSEPWFEHRDLAVMCAVQKAGLIAIDFTDICLNFKQYERTIARWVSKQPRPVGAKAVGVGRGPGRAGRAAKKALREIAASFPLSQITSGIIDIAGDVRLQDTRVAMETIRAACPDETPFVLGFGTRGNGPFLKINLIAVAGRGTMSPRTTSRHCRID